MNEKDEQVMELTAETEDGDIYVPVQYKELVDLITARTERDVILVVAEECDYSYPLQEILKAIVALHSPEGETVEPDEEDEDDDA